MRQLSGDAVATANGVLAPAQRISFESLEHVCLTPHQAEIYTSKAQHEVVFAVGRATIAVRFSRLSAAQAFAVRFGDTLAQGAPDRVVYAVVAHGQAFFWHSADQARRWPQDPSDELLVFFADNFALHDYLTTSADLGLHAAVIANDSCVAAIVGVSTAGKTTTALAAVRSGFRFYSDDRCILQSGCVVPFLRAITLRDGGRAALLADRLDTTMNVTLRTLPAGQENAIRPRQLFGDRAGGPPRPLNALFLIDGRAAEAAVTADRTFYDSLPVVLSSMVSRDRGIDRAARVLSEMRGIATYRLRLGTPHSTAVLIQRTLNEVVAGARS